MKLNVRRESFRLAEVFTIARGSKTAAEVVTATLSDGPHVGRGECVPYARYGETVESVIAQIEGAALTREGVAALPAGAARNALDCALWDLEAKQAGKPVWKLASLPMLGPVTSAYTLSLADADTMRAKAAEHSARPLLKIKLGTPDDLPRLEAVRQGAPKSHIIVDANEGWRAEDYVALQPDLKRLGVALVEQPLPAGEDDALADMERLISVCADESCHDRSSLPALKGKYDLVNIKLDKTGGLTEALALRAEAREQGFGVMVGCMVGTSLAMAPAMLVAQSVGVVDLDGPLLLAEDRDPPLRFDGSLVHPPKPELWG